MSHWLRLPNAHALYGRCERLAPFAVVALAALLLWPLLFGRMPLTQDHTVHLFRAWHFFEKELAFGRLTGWSDFWFAGWPAGDDYPPGADFWMAIARLLTLPLSWEATYAVGFVAMFAVSGLATYSVARFWGAWPAFVAAALFLLDRGAYREGGFTYTVFWGVWPQQLSTAMVLFGFAALLRDRDEPQGIRWLVAAVLAFGYALLCHPLALILIACALLSWAIAHVGKGCVRATARFVLAASVGWALAAFWSVPFGARSNWMASYGDLWKPLGAIALGLVRGNLFQQVPAPIVWVGLVGFGVGVVRRDRIVIFLGLWAALLLVAASSTTFAVLHLGKLSNAFGQIQFQRLVVGAKVALFLLSGFGIGRALDGLVGRWASLGLITRVATMAALAFLRPGRVETARDARLETGYRQFLDWSRDERMRAQEFYRIAYVGPYNDHTFAAAPIENNTPAYKVGFTPCSNFLHKPDSGTAEIYRVLGIRYVVSRRPLHESTLTLERRFGPIYVYRFLNYSPQRYTVIGAGTVDEAQFGRDTMRLRLSGTDRSSRVILHVAHYPGWHATLDGKPVRLDTAALADEPIFLEVPAHGSDLRVEYRSLPVDLAGKSLTVCTLLALAFAVCRRPRLESLERPVFLATLGLIAVALGGAAWKITRPVRRPAWALRDTVEQLNVSVVRNSERVVCESKARGGRFRCSQQSWNWVGQTRQRIGGVVRECVWAHPVAGGAMLELQARAVSLGHALVVRHGLTDRAVDAQRDGAPVHLDVALDGVTVAREVRPNRKGWVESRVNTSARAGTSAMLTLAIRAERDTHRNYCVDVEVE